MLDLTQLETGSRPSPILVRLPAATTMGNVSCAHARQRICTYALSSLYFTHSRKRFKRSRIQGRSSCRVDVARELAFTGTTQAGQYVLRETIQAGSYFCQLDFAHRQVLGQGCACNPADLRDSAGQLGPRPLPLRFFSSLHL